LKSSCLTPLPLTYESPRLEQPLPAVEFYQKACGLNYGGGCFNLGLMYSNGEGVKQDDFKAVELKSSCLTPSPLSYENPRLEQPPP
jgi:hypothetical protein